MQESVVTKHQMGGIILRQGSAERCLFQILSGSVALSADGGKPEEYRVLSAPRIFGELTALTGQPSRHTAVAVTEATVLRVPEEALPSFIQNNPESVLALMKAMAWALSGLPEDAPKAPEPKPPEAPPKAPAPAAGTAEPSPPPPPAAPVPPAPSAAPAVPVPPARSGEPKPASGPFLPGHRGYAGITHPEYRAMVYDKKLTCPHCKKSFTGTRVFQSKLAAAQAPGKARYDLRTFYVDFQMEWFDVITCPHCCFSTLGNFFLEPKHLNKDRYSGELAKLKAELKPDFAAERSLEFVLAQHYLALACAEGFDDRLQLKARFWTNIAWLYEDAGDEEPMRLAEAKAIEANKEVYLQCRLNPAQEQRICMMLAGFLYRAGDKTEAREWAFKARVNRMGKPVYAELAEQLISDIREELKN